MPSTVVSASSNKAWLAIARRDPDVDKRSSRLVRKRPSPHSVQAYDNGKRRRRNHSHNQLKRWTKPEGRCCPSGPDHRRCDHGDYEERLYLESPPSHDL